MTTAPLLLVSDQIAGRVRLLTVPDGTPVAALEGRHLAEHPGFLALPGGRLACVDDRAGELLVLDPFGALRGGPLVGRRLPVATPAEQLAADPAGRRLALTTGLGDNNTPWSELLTVLDLASGDCVRVRTRAGEPGVTVLTDPADGDGTWVALRHREPGAWDVHRWSDLLDAAPGCPPAAAHHSVPLPPDGHGDAQDPLSGRTFAATSEGVHRARLQDGVLLPEATLPWRAPGRGYFLRLDPRRRTLWSCLRGGPAEPHRWSEWTNHAWRHEIDGHRTEVCDLGPGLVFRMAFTGRHAAFTRIHPDGDELLLLDAGSSRPEVVRRVPLSAMEGAPQGGRSPWEGVQRRAVAASPGAGWVAVSRGGHGEVLLLDADGGGEPRVLDVGTPLDHGGRLAMIGVGDGAEGDANGR
ncbi:hypothetical protein GL263_08205 [Streptomyces durbertensis]|uniref:Uncharacterized protein n=1 Tax=Streptomyces durbertensis TaxID=2448886 RepID=A0ABR6EDZ2_9ACTN|nr:hypothetical protein [Streptomyces durbertensis]MBB1243543.1 hypothetical protein [Streptomyces durbertensis]